MRTRGRVLAFAGAVVLIAFVVSVGAVGGPQAPKVAEKKVDSKALDKEKEALGKLLDEAKSGAPNPLQLSLEPKAFLRGQRGTFVPFTVSLDAAQIPGGSVSALLRLKKRGAADPAAKGTGKANAAEYAWNDISQITLKPAETGQSLSQFVRAFMVPAGEYDLAYAVREMNPAKGQQPKTATLVQTVKVPDFGTGELTMSSVILVGKLIDLPAPLTAEQQRERPLAFGQMEIVLKPDTKYKKTESFLFFAWVYNMAGDAANKPDVQVDYTFFVKNTDGTEKKFNATEPALFNAKTLPAQFDVKTINQVNVAQEVALAKFPAGDFRLEIKVTDKLANKTIVASVPFSVVAS